MGKKLSSIQLQLLHAFKFSRDETFALFAVQKTIREYFEQVLQNCKKWTPNSALFFIATLYWIGSTNTNDTLLDIRHLQRFPGIKWSTMLTCSQHPRKQNSWILSRFAIRESLVPRNFSVYGSYSSVEVCIVRWGKQDVSHLTFLSSSFAPNAKWSLNSLTDDLPLQFTSCFWAGIHYLVQFGKAGYTWTKPL